MPQSKFQKMMYAFITVVITVHAFVFYSLYVVNGNTFLQLQPDASGVLDAIGKMGGVYMCGRFCPIWAVVLLEFVLAYTLECVAGSPLSFKIACKIFNPQKDHHVLFETAIICATVFIMCPAMSFIASFLYYPYYEGFNIFTLLAEWLKLVCYNLPFALFSQIFFIQPLVHRIFGFCFRKKIS
ncbi:MAG: hypothetical protein K2K91_01760 [Ruminococcus sp.]|nr:hypothetical protein [Ruminococcus sp.]